MTFSNVAQIAILAAPDRYFGVPLFNLTVNVTAGNGSFLQVLYNNTYFDSVGTLSNPALENMSNFFWRNGSQWSELTTSRDITNNFFQISNPNASLYSIFGNPSLCYELISIPSVIHNTTSQSSISIGSSFLNVTAIATLNNDCTTGAVNNTIFYFNESESGSVCDLGGFNCAVARNLTSNNLTNFTYSYRIAITTTETDGIAQGGFTNPNNNLFSLETSYIRDITGIIFEFTTPSASFPRHNRSIQGSSRSFGWTISALNFNGLGA